MKHNKADIKRSSYQDHPMQDQARLNTTLAGKNLAPWGFDYEGSATIHYYKKPNSNDFIFITHLSNFNSIPEAQADVGHKELRRSMMKAYGREDVRRTDTKEEIL